MGFQFPFGRKNSGPGSFTPSDAASSLSHVLRILGEYSLPTSDKSRRQTQKLYLGWSKHIADGRNPKDLESDPRQDVRRDWSGLTKFCADLRISEQEFFTRSSQSARLLLWQMVNLIGRSMRSEQQSEDQVMVSLNRLKDATRSKSFEELKKQSLEVIKEISEISDQRRTNQKLQLQDLGTKLKALREELETTRKQLVLDPLTQVYNRKAFDEHIERIVDLSLFSGKPASLMMIDVDFFKKINDTYGHPAGDAVLVALAKSMIDSFPRRNDLVARYGGEEFVIILQEDGRDVAMTLAEKFRRKIEKEKVPSGDQQISFTLSIGIAELKPAEGVENWLKRADQALYNAKEGGRNKVVVSQAVAKSA